MICPTKQTRSLHRAGLDPLPQLDRLIGTDRAQHGGEAGVEELLHLRRRALGQPFGRVACRDVAMRVDEPGHDRPALGIDALHARRRSAGSDGHDLAAPHDDRSAFDDSALAVENPGVDDGQILRRDLDRYGDERNERHANQCDHRSHATSNRLAVPLRDRTLEL